MGFPNFQLYGFQRISATVTREKNAVFLPERESVEFFITEWIKVVANATQSYLYRSVESTFSTVGA